ncbi:hypothetical protein LEMLEM_LOCUS26990, partial [Lemmus lemmus]
REKYPTQGRSQRIKSRASRARRDQTGWPCPKASPDCAPVPETVSRRAHYPGADFWKKKRPQADKRMGAGEWAYFSLPCSKEIKIKIHTNTCHLTLLAPKVG